MTSDAELDPATIEMGCFYRQPPETVWRGLTEPELVERWLLRPTGFSPAVGTHFIFAVPSDPPGEVACEVLAARPAEQLMLSWVDLRAKYPRRWIVDWMVSPQGHGTRLLLTQTGFDVENKRQRMARNALERGWRTCLGRLGEVLEQTAS